MLSMFRKYLTLKRFVLCDSDQDYILSYGLSNQLNKFA